MVKARSGLTQRIGIGFIWVSFIVLGMALALFGPFTRSAAGQTMMGDFTGIVTDSSGNGIQGAQVSIVNDDTHGTRTATTDNSGTFRANGFLPGNYTFDVTASGFKAYVQTGVILTPAGVKPVNIQLSVGGVTQEVKITGQTPLISTESQAITMTLPSAYLEKPTTIDTQQYGNYEEFMAWMPGSSAGGQYQFGGTRPSNQQNNIEGIQNQMRFQNADVDSFETATVVEMAPAEYARQTTTDGTIKSGTNSPHGSIRMDALMPCLYAPNTPFSGGQNPEYPCNGIWWLPDFGASGPVFVPHVYDGRNKSFFYFGLKRDFVPLTNAPLQFSSPTLAMQGGDFSNYPKIITDPTTGSPFPGNVIPANRLSPVAQNIVNADFGNHLDYLGSPNNFSNNASAAGLLKLPTTMWSLKIDQNIGSKDILSVVWLDTATEAQDLTSDENGCDLGADTLTNNQLQTSKMMSIAETHVLSPNIVNELRLGFSRAFWGFSVTQADFSTPVYGDTTMNAWGLQGLSNTPHLEGEPTLIIDDWGLNNNCGGNHPPEQIFEWDTRPQGYDNITLIKGKHTYKAGFSAVKFMDDGPGILSPGSAGPYWGSYEFTSQFTGDGFADFLLGLPGSFSVQSTRPNIARRDWEYGLFAQDDFRVTPRLTASYGLRWGRYTAPYDKSGLYYNFDPANDDIVVPGAQSLAAVSPAWPVNVFPVVLASQDNFPSKLTSPGYSLQPRLGFSYRFNSKTVLRGGFGFYTGAVHFNALNLGGPFGLTSSYINAPDLANPSGALYSWPDPFPATVGFAHVLTASGVTKNYHDPYSLNAQISVERELLPNWGFRATYLGVIGRQLIWTENVNSPFISTTPYTQASNPNPNLEAIKLTQNGARSDYNGITLVLEHPWEHGLWSQISYTRAWNRTDAQGGTIARDDQNSYTPEYAYDLRRDWGNDGVDVPNDFILNTTAEAPVGRGKYLASNANWLVNGVIGNWSVTATYNWHSGRWFNPVESGIDPGNIGNFSSRRVNLIPGCNPHAGAHDQYGLWFNPACYTAPPNGQLGTTPLNSLLGPNEWVLNLNPYKEFPLWFREGAKLRVGAQLMNALNHPAYSNPISDLSNPLVGTINSITSVRYIEFGGMRETLLNAKLIF